MKLLRELIDYLKKAFSEKGSPSTSRLLTIPHSVAAIFCLVYVTIVGKHLPSPSEMAGLGSFATVHYLVNRVSGSWGTKDAKGMTTQQ